MSIFKKTDKHTCPRRAEDGTDDPTSPFVGAGPNQDTYKAGHGLIGQARGCSYCGSMHPDDFMEEARSGRELGVTDKNYKVYVEGPTKGKFYYQHLSTEQKKEFVDLYNAKTLHIGWPGFFTVYPYFMGRAEK